MMDEYFETFGGVRDYLGGIVDEARRSGFTETIMGRRRYLPDLTSDNRQRREMAERMALNAPIQGSAADIIKVAMLKVDAAIRAEGLRSRMLLQVHDELVLEVAPGEREALEALVRARWRRPPTSPSRWTSPSAPATAGTKPLTDQRQGQRRARSTAPRAPAEALRMLAATSTARSATSTAATVATSCPTLSMKGVASTRVPSATQIASTARRC